MEKPIQSEAYFAEFSFNEINIYYMNTFSRLVG